MATAMVDEVAKKKAPQRTTSDDVNRKALAIQVRGTEEWKAWSEKLARFDKRPLASLVEIALSRYATEIGFKDEPPAR